VAIGRAAAAYGKFQAARESFAAAGQWVELMPLCALQGDFDALRDYAARVSGSQVGHSSHTSNSVRLEHYAARVSGSHVGVLSPTVQDVRLQH